MKDNFITHSHNGKTHTHPILSHIRSTPAKEIFLKEEVVNDDELVEYARSDFNSNTHDLSKRLKLIDCLNLQMRYQEVINLCIDGLKEYPNDYALNRALAIRYMSTCQNKKCLDILKKLEKETNDELDIAYKLGLVYYYIEDYKLSKDYFIKCLSLSNNDDEMYIASLYWYLMCLVENNEDIISNLNKYYKDIHILHHVGYKLVIDLFLNKKDIDLLEKESNIDNLTRVIYLYGMYEYYLNKKEDKLAKDIFYEGLACDEYWSSFSGLAFWNKYINKKK